jgi:hypothetical protein
VRKVRQIHCVLDCIAYVLQTGISFDYRPLYFGVWDAPFVVSDEGISYYSNSIGIEDICRQFEQLYGKSITILNDYAKDKSENYATLVKQLANKDRNQFIFILVDLFYLPYPNQCYQTRHRPHIIIIDHIEDNKCYLIDPYFSWEDYVSIEIFEQSFYCGDLNAIVMVDKSGLHNPDIPNIAECLNNHINVSPSQLITQVNAIVDKVISQEEGYTLDKLYQSIEQVSVIVKRLNGYEMAFSYLNEALNIQTNDCYNKVAELIKKWDNIMLSTVRLGILGNRNGLQPLKDKISHIGLMESAIKKDLWNLYKQWEGYCHRINT